MGCCDDAEYQKGGWDKAVAAEGLCFRFHQAKDRPVYTHDDVVMPGDYLVRCPALNITFRVGAADFEKYFEPLMAETKDAD